jgi:hypothetical protein
MLSYCIPIISINHHPLALGDLGLFIHSRMKLDGSVAVVTGGARGIGKAITKALLQNKAKVVFQITIFYLINGWLFRSQGSQNEI